MSSVEFLFDIYTGDISETVSDIHPIFCDIIFGLKKEEPNELVRFRHLTFGYTILDKSNNILVEKKYPQGKGRFVRSTQKILMTDRIEHEHDSEYTLKFWVEHDGVKIEKEVQIITPNLEEQEPEV